MEDSFVTVAFSILFGSVRLQALKEINIKTETIKYNFLIIIPLSNNISQLDINQAEIFNIPLSFPIVPAADGIALGRFHNSKCANGAHIAIYVNITSQTRYCSKIDFRL